MHEGHRKRMLERATSGGTLQDHELLEILLYNCIPRKNTNEIAHRLLTAYGSLKDVFRASEEELEGVEGVGRATAQYLKAVSELIARVCESGDSVPKAFSFGQFSVFLEDRYRGLCDEVLEIFCLDARDRIKFTARFTSEDSGHVSIRAEDISRIFLSHHPAGIVAAHNHPEGPAYPSEQDDRFTAQVQMLCSLNGVRLRDHVIVGKGGTFSYFMYGRLEEVEKSYPISRLESGKRIL